MRLAVISDVHGNYKALEAFLKYLEKHPVDGIICLGDYLTDSPYPQRTMKLLYEMQKQYHCYMIRGNREQYLLDNAKSDAGWKPSSSNGALYYTAQNVTKADLDFLESLPEERELLFEGYPALYICHGTPGKLRGNVEVEEGLREKALQEISQKYLLGGHSHHQEMYEAFGKVYVNPGSLGISMDGVGGIAPFAILTAVKKDKSSERTPNKAQSQRSDEVLMNASNACCQRSDEMLGKSSNACGEEYVWQVELLSIPYDVDNFLKDFTECGLDEYGMVLNRAIKKSLVTGVNYFYMSVEEAAKLGNCSIDKVSEEIWNKVADKLGL